MLGSMMSDHPTITRAERDDGVHQGVVAKTRPGHDGKTIYAPYNNQCFHSDVALCLTHTHGR